MRQLAHITVIMLGKQVGNRFTPVIQKLLAARFVVDSHPRSHGQPSQHVVATPFLKFPRHR